MRRAFGVDACNVPTIVAAPGDHDILARFAFDWTGTPGDFEFTLDLDTLNSYLRLTDFSKEAFALPTGQWYSGPIIDADDNSFTVHIPEPVSISLLGLGGLVILRRRRR